MHQGNRTVFEFFLLGLSAGSEQQQLIFMLLLCMYLVTMVGNLLIILAIINDAHLQSPMYFFLANLSFTDICFTNTTIPKMLVDIQSQSSTISFSGCLSQMYFFMLLVDLDNFLLAAMAYDCYIAICHPLHYAALLSPKHCTLLVVTPWVISILVSTLHLSLLNLLTFCDKREIPHFFCDLEPILKLACSDTQINDLTILVTGGAVIFIPFAFIIVSYALIGCTVLRVPSAKGKWKTFSTCSSHLSAVSLFYGSIIAVYFLPSSHYSPERDKVAAIMYTIVTPMMNPFIYSLRNKDMKGALRKLFSRKKYFDIKDTCINFLDFTENIEDPKPQATGKVFTLDVFTHPFLAPNPGLRLQIRLVSPQTHKQTKMFFYSTVLHHLHAEFSLNKVMVI